MKLLGSALLLGTASAVVPPQQHVFKGALERATDAWLNPFRPFAENFKRLSHDARAAWDEAVALFPEAAEKMFSKSHPKPHTRRPDSQWDYITSGAAVQSVWVENADGEQERDVHGKLENYNLRSRKVDPSKLGVDPGVKQYSGYLDDEEKDKHLFYCQLPQNRLRSEMVLMWDQGSLSHAMIPQRTL